MKIFLPVLAFLFSCLLALPAEAGQLAQLAETPKPNPAQEAPILNEAALKANILARVGNILKANNAPNAPRPEELSPDLITIEKTHQVALGDLNLFAVKARVVRPTPGGGFDNMILTVDASGQYMFGMVNELATGEEAVMSRAADITAMVLPDKFQSQIYTGTGSHDIVFVSDPFCPYCREAFNFLMANMDKISGLKMVHLPLPIHPGADAASWIMDYAHDSGIRAAEIVNFAYTGLKAPVGKIEDEAREDVIKQIIERFPDALTKERGNAGALLAWLKNGYQARTLLAIDEMRKEGITGTPLILVDNIPVRGFDKNALARLLGR